MRFRLLALALLAAAAVPTAALATGGAGTIELYASLLGKTEIPKGDPKASGTAEIKLTPSTGKVCWEFKLKGVVGPAAAHIHKGKAGTAGLVVVPFGTAYKRQGCTTAAKSLIKAIIASPGSYYVNVHTAKYPAGSVRGQLSKTASSTSSGSYSY
jgi:CHRD domain